MRRGIGHRRVGKMRILLKIMIFLLLLQPGAAVAISRADKNAVYFDHVFYGGESTSEACEGGNIPSSVELDAPIIEAINKNRKIYESASAKTGVPWQMLAGVHYRETTLGRTNPENGDGLYQILNSDYEQGPVSDEEFLEQTIRAAQILQAKTASNVERNRKPLTADTTNTDLIKDTLFGYNGRSSLYAQEAAKYGFDPATEPYEGSPYVMNRFDAQRKSMGIIRVDYGPIDHNNPDTKFGAFTIYSRLSGLTGCTNSGSKVVDVALAELAKNVREVPDGSNKGPRIDIYTDGNAEPWCADFISWVYKEAGQPFSGGLSDGWRIPGAQSLPAWLKANGKWFDKGSSDTPMPGDVVYFIWGGDGDDDHVGIVEKVDGETMITIEGNSSNSVARREYDQYNTHESIVGWGRMK